MTSLGKDIAAAWFMGMILPGIILNGAVMLKKTAQLPRDIQATVATEKATQHPSSELTMYLRNRDGSIGERNMDAYLVEAVLAEMPASFGEEALKAQAVVARTYARKAYETGGKHGDGSVCTQSSCCQAHITQEEYLKQGGTEESIEKVHAAVKATSGYVLTYEGTLIEATYFSCSGGSTEDAAAVWGADYPYLQAVDSPGEENAAYYEDTVFFTPREFCDALGISLSGSPSGWFGPVSYTEGGGVDTMNIGGKAYRGTELRSALSLRSTRFTVAADETTIAITTRGYGHRVGMSQYGADAMAAAGSTYPDILAHYYPGTSLSWMG